MELRHRYEIVTVLGVMQRYITEGELPVEESITDRVLLGGCDRAFRHDRCTREPIR